MARRRFGYMLGWWLVLLLAGGSAVMAAPGAAPQRLIVGLRPGTDDASAARAAHIRATGDAVLARHAGQVQLIRRYHSIPALVVRTDAAGRAALAADPAVTHIAEDRLLAPALNESTTIVGAAPVWARGYTGAGQAVAILDTGITRDHPFLTGAVIDEACFSTNDTGTDAFGNPYPIVTLCPNGLEEQYGSGAGADCDASRVASCGHGTHVAGIVAGRTRIVDLAGRPTTVRGVAPAASLISIQIFSEVRSTVVCGGAAACARTFISDQIAALEYVEQLTGFYDIAAVTMSLGGGREASTCDAAYPAYTDVVRRLAVLGVSTVAATGNDGFRDGIWFPACLSGVVSVGSSTTSSSGGAADRLSGFSNTTAWLDLLAPGEYVLSSFANGSYGYLAGTSMAAPHVAGAFALLGQAVPAASAATLRAALHDSGAPVTANLGGASVVLRRLNLRAALDALAPSQIHIPFLRR